jgi:hypothetical protein
LCTFFILFRSSGYWYRPFLDLFDFSLQIEYPDEIQLAFLRLNSLEASQKFTYYCKNSIAWYDGELSSYSHAITFEGYNKEKIETSDISDVQDGCSVRFILFFSLCFLIKNFNNFRHE